MTFANVQDGLQLSRLGTDGAAAAFSEDIVVNPQITTLVILKTNITSCQLQIQKKEPCFFNLDKHRVHNWKSLKLQRKLLQSAYQSVSHSVLKNNSILEMFSWLRHDCNVFQLNIIWQHGNLQRALRHTAHKWRGKGNRWKGQNVSSVIASMQMRRWSCFLYPWTLSATVKRGLVCKCV